MFIGQHVMVQHDLMRKYGAEVAVFIQDLNNEIRDNGVTREFGRCVPLNNEELQERFDYIPFSRLKKTIAQLKKTGEVRVKRVEGITYYAVNTEAVNED